MYEPAVELTSADLSPETGQDVQPLSKSTETGVAAIPVRSPLLMMKITARGRLLALEQLKHEITQKSFEIPLRGHSHRADVRDLEQGIPERPGQRTSSHPVRPRSALMVGQRSAR